MDTDLQLVIGIVLAVFSVPAIVSALSDSRPPRVAAVVLVAAGCLIFYAIHQMPRPFTWQEIPNAFVRVAAELIR